MANELIAAVAGAALAAAAPDGQADAPRLTGSFPLVELRQYTLHDGQRDALIELFEREFVESQEAVGMKVIGTFTDLDRPNRFVWLRGFRDMDSRAAGLSAFYAGPVWQAHREAANSTMIDSDNVLLLRAPSVEAEFRKGTPGGMIVGTIFHLNAHSTGVLTTFETVVKPGLDEAGAPPIAWFTPETAPNNYPRLPVREGERLLVWFARFDDEADHAARRTDIAQAIAPLLPLLERDPEFLRLMPTTRSELR